MKRYAWMGPLLCCVLILTGGRAWGQEAAPAPTATPEGAAGQASPAPPAEVPMSDVMTHTNVAEARRQEVEARLEGGEGREGRARLEAELPGVMREIATREAEDGKALAQEPPLELLLQMEQSWRETQETLGQWQERLSARGRRLEADVIEFRAMGERWVRTLEALRRDNAPAEVVEHVVGFLGDISLTRERLEQERTRTLELQSRVAKEIDRVKAIQARVKAARKAADLFERNEVPLWEMNLSRKPVEEWGVGKEWSRLKEYARQSYGAFAINAVWFFVFLGVFIAARRWVNGLEEEHALEPLHRAVAIPVAGALVLAMVVGHWCYPQPPRLLQVLMRAAALIPALLLLKRLIPVRMYPVLYVLVAFFLADVFRLLYAPLPVVTRAVFVVKMVAGVFFCIWFRKRVEEFPEEDKAWEGVACRGTVLAAGLFMAAFLANSLGYGRVSVLVGSALLQSVYLAVVLAGLSVILSGLLLGLLSVPPLSRLGMVRRFKELIWKRVRLLIQLSLGAVWFWLTLRFFGLNEWLGERVSQFMQWKPWGWAFLPTPRSVVEFVVVVWAAFLLSRLIRFVLEEDVYPRVTLPRGIPYAISTVLHYAVLLGGFFLALGALGIDLTKVTILAGAFGVGLGFGLQTIVNNFVSGLILLFERPVNVGDVIEVDPVSHGIVSRIGIRASTIKTLDGGEVIMPNGKLIADKVVNWTRLKRQRMMVIAIPITAGGDPEAVLALLEEVGQAHPKVSSYPKATALLVKVLPAQWDFELRIWTNYYDDLLEIRSEVTVAALKGLKELAEAAEAAEATAST